MNFYHFALNSEIHKVIIFVNINYFILFGYFGEIKLFVMTVFNTCIMP